MGRTYKGRTEMSAIEAAELLESNRWSDDLEAIKYPLAAWLRLVAKYGPLEQHAIDLAEILLDEFHNNIGAN